VLTRGMAGSFDGLDQGMLESQNQRMFRVGRDLCGSSRPTPQKVPSVQLNVICFELSFLGSLQRLHGGNMSRKLCL